MYSFCQSAPCEHGSEGSINFGNFFITLKPPTTDKNGIFWVRDPECGGSGFPRNVYVSATACSMRSQKTAI